MLGNTNRSLAQLTAMVTPPPKSQARRRLDFGETPKSTITKFQDYVQQELNLMCTKSQVKWGFDFTNDRPLPGGHFNWALVDQNKEYIPGPYISTYRPKPKAPRKRPATAPSSTYARAAAVKRKLNFDQKPVLLFADENVSPLARCGVEGSDSGAAQLTNTTATATTTTTSHKNTHLRQPTITEKFQQQKKKMRKVEKSSSM